MDKKALEVTQIAAQILSGMLANPHVYARVSDEGALGQQEQELKLIAVEMALQLIAEVEKRSEHS